MFYTKFSRCRITGTDYNTMGCHAIYPMMALSAILLGSLVRATATCYNFRGEKWSGGVPCFPDQPVSHCCSQSDYCLSNGLCLDAGADNSYTTQGCTIQQWSSPCITNCVQWARKLVLCTYFAPASTLTAEL